MTLYRQVAALIFLVFVLLLSATAWSGFRHARQSLEGQLQATARDMATSLGIAIANSPQGTDPAFVDTLFNAAFDSGFLSSIELRAPDGRLITSKQQQISIQGVPEWFLSLARIEAATGESPIMRNWMPYATLSLTVHPGYAYTGMYIILKSNVLWFTTITVIGMSVLWLLLHHLLSPLHAIEEQANAIHENRFIQQTPLPRTRELRRVAEAMNGMVSKIQALLSEQTEALSRYHAMLYRDALTGLGNRRSFLAGLDQRCRDETARRGCLAVIRLHGLEEIAWNSDYQRVDTLVSGLAQLIRDKLGTTADEHCARIKDDEFALYMDHDAEKAKSTVGEVFASFQETLEGCGFGNIAWLCAGVSSLHAGSTTGSILSDMDFALTQAAQSGAYALHDSTRDEQGLPQGRMQWHSWLQEALDKHRFFLVTQPVVESNAALFHREVFVRLRDEQGRVFTAGVFMPVANSLGLDHLIEFEVFEMATRLDAVTTSAALAVNLSSMVFTDSAADTALERAVNRYRDAHESALHLEARHFLLQHHAQAAAGIFQRFRELGCTLGIDNLDLSLPLDLLQDLRPHYVKVSAATLVDMANKPGLGGYQALRTLLDGLGIRLMAVGIDSQDTHNTLQKLGIDAAQGNHIQLPQETP